MTADWPAPIPEAGERSFPIITEDLLAAPEEAEGGGEVEAAIDDGIPAVDALATTEFFFAMTLFLTAVSSSEVAAGEEDGFGAAAPLLSVLLLLLEALPLQYPLLFLLTRFVVAVAGAAEAPFACTCASSPPCTAHLADSFLHLLLLGVGVGTSLSFPAADITAAAAGAAGTGTAVSSSLPEVDPAPDVASSSSLRWSSSASLRSSSLSCTSMEEGRLLKEEDCASASCLRTTTEEDGEALEVSGVRILTGTGGSQETSSAEEESTAEVAAAASSCSCRIILATSCSSEFREMDLRRAKWRPLARRRSRSLSSAAAATAVDGEGILDDDAPS